MNSSRVHELEFPKFYIPFHAAYDVLYISSIKSKTECLEFKSRDTIIPPSSLLAEHRMSIQQLYQSMLGYKKCCSTDKNYDKESALSCKLAISKMIFPSETNEEIEFKGTLLECDLFSVLVSYIYYYDRECKIEEFDRLVQILFAAKLLQTVLNPCTEEIQSSEENMDITSLHPNVIEFLQLIVNIVPDICKIEDITSFN